MISVTRLLGGQSFFGDRLRYDRTAISQRHGTRRDAGPVVVWNATKSCNLACIHCYANAARRRFSGELTTAEARGMIDDLASFRVPALLISGGEPLVRHDILDLAEYATGQGIRVTLSTNGTLLDPETAGRLRVIGVTYAGISIDGSEKYHDHFRARRGAYREALRGIRNCRAAGIRAGIRFTLTTGNAGDIDSIFDLVEREEIGRLCIYHLVYSGRGANLEGIDLDRDAKRAFMGHLLERVERWNHEKRDIEVMTVDNHADGPFIYCWLNEHRDHARAAAALELMQSNGGNRSGMAIGAIDSFGVVHPDQFTWHALGSIRERPFSRIWTDHRAVLLEQLRDRKKLLRGRCATCRWLPVCNGNFRARAEAATGDYWASDPACYLTEMEIAQ